LASDSRMLRWLGDSLSAAAGGLGIHKMYHDPRDYLRITTLGAKSERTRRVRERRVTTRAGMQ